MKTISIVSIFVSLIIFCSCMVEEKISFNNDHSGTVYYKLDLSAMNSMMTVFDSTEGPKASILDSIFAQDAFNALKNADGISHVNYSESRETGIIECTFHFAGLAALNAAINHNSFLNGESDFSNFEYFSGSAKTLKLTTPVPTKSEGKEDNFMGDLFTYKFSLAFEKPVKKTDNKDFRLSEDKKEMTMEGQLMNLQIQPSKLNVNIKF